MSDEHQIKILLVDDEPFNLEILEDYLEMDGYELDTAADGEEAWTKLSADGARFDVVLLDRMMPGMDGIETLRRIKSNSNLKSIPVIMQTAKGGAEATLEGIQAGAYYYLVKPFEESMLRSIVNTAVKDRLNQLEIESNLAQQTQSLLTLQEGHFRFQTLDDASNLATMIARICPDPNKVAIGLTELMVNAVEHGNLKINYDEKSELLSQGRWNETINKRLLQDQYKDKWVDVEFTRRTENKSIEVTVKDAGQGFDWQNFMEMSPDRVLDNHGRGIAMANLISFQSLEYQGSGNIVKAVIDD